VKRKIILSGFVLILGIVGIFFSLEFILTGMKVSITNNTASPITDLHLYYTDGVKEARAVASHSVQRFTVKPSGESALLVDYSDSTGKRHKHSVDVYIEPSYSGRVDIIIENDYRIKWTMESKLYWFRARSVVETGP